MGSASSNGGMMSPGGPRRDIREVQREQRAAQARARSRRFRKERRQAQRAAFVRHPMVIALTVTVLVGGEAAILLAVF
jgi:hypothetical protein